MTLFFVRKILDICLLRSISVCICARVYLLFACVCVCVFFFLLAAKCKSKIKSLILLLGLLADLWKCCRVRGQQANGDGEPSEGDRERAK